MSRIACLSDERQLRTLGSLQFEDIRGCNHTVGYGVYPNLDRNLKGKLEFLKERRQNLYADP